MTPMEELAELKQRNRARVLLVLVASIQMNFGPRNGASRRSEEAALEAGSREKRVPGF